MAVISKYNVTMYFPALFFVSYFLSIKKKYIYILRNSSLLNKHHLVFCLYEHDI